MPPEQNFPPSPVPVPQLSKWKQPVSPFLAALVILLFLSIMWWYITAMHKDIVMFWMGAPAVEETYTPVIRRPRPVAMETGEVDMTGWKTYTNAEYGFEFKYPENWVSHDMQGRHESMWVAEIQEHYEKEGFSSGRVNITTETEKTIDGAFAHASLLYQQNSYKSRPSKPEIVSIDGVSAVKQSYSPYEISPPSTTYSFPTRGIALSLEDASGTPNSPADYSNKIRETILSTFHFLPSAN